MVAAMTIPLMKATILAGAPKLSQTQIHTLISAEYTKNHYMPRTVPMEITDEDGEDKVILIED